MPRTVIAFTHLDETYEVDDFIHEDHDLVRLAPHLFEQPEPDPEPDPNAEPVRIRGPLVAPPKPKPAPRATTPKED